MASCSRKSASEVANCNTRFVASENGISFRACSPHVVSLPCSVRAQNCSPDSADLNAGAASPSSSIAVGPPRAIPSRRSSR
jgi:hypothetical protein